MTVQEIMTPNPVTVDVTDTVQDVIDVLNDMDIRHVPVIDNGILAGMISDRDLRDFTLPMMVSFNNPEQAAERCKTPIAQVMHSDVITVGSESEISEVAEIMIDHKIGAVPVCDQIEGELIGIVSYVDVLRAATDLF